MTVQVGGSEGMEGLSKKEGLMGKDNSVVVAGGWGYKKTKSNVNKMQ